MNQSGKNHSGAYTPDKHVLREDQDQDRGAVAERPEAQLVDHQHHVMQTTGRAAHSSPNTVATAVDPGGWTNPTARHTAYPVDAQRNP